MKTQHIVQLVAVFAMAALSIATHAFTPSQQPPDTVAVPGNVVLALSVEFPTATQASYTTKFYNQQIRYEGYFDNRKCYSYSTANEVFTPVSAQNANGSCPVVATQWAGNLLNWLTMSNLDQFRSVMTGGTRDTFSTMATAHPGDTTSRTVLIRTFGSQQGGSGNNPNRALLVNTNGVPSDLTSNNNVNKTVRSFGYGSKFIVSDDPDVNDNIDNLSGFNLTLANQKATCLATPLPGAVGTSRCFNIRIEVCIPVIGVGLEANCESKYTLSSPPSVPKPEGLIQKYSSDMRFAALGYLNVAGGTRNGAVLRSAMKSVGPDAATASGVVANPAPEWNSTTGIMSSNPNPDDATASNVPNSGLMNYLNKFGYSGIYQTNDNVSELFYASQLYLRGREPPADYSNNLTAVSKDDFPVITGSNLLRSGTRDPIIQTCQKNYILGIGDTNTHCDGNLPGSTNTKCSLGTPSDPDGVNVQSLLNTIAGYEGIAPNAIARVGVGSNTGGGNTPYIASLAYWGNTTDIRNDLSGTQNIRTYWVDVLEGGIPGYPTANPGTLKTQYWMATKYGGFKTDLVTGNNPNTNPLSWDSDNNASPDNWFAGNNPQSMRNGLSQAFKSIADDSAGSASSAAVSSTRQTAGSLVIYAAYDPKNWGGTVTACLPTQTAAECAVSPQWEASRWFKTTPPLAVATPLTDSTRKIFTSQRTATFSKMPFRWGDMNASQQTTLNAADGLGSNRLDYLRGKRSNEGVNSTDFRVRNPNLLGDIVNSGVTYLAGSSPAYSGAKFPGHAAYRSATKNRPAVVYVGSNDGMLHAFSGTDGKELFGYIPGSVFTNLPKLTEQNFKHSYFVDGTPMVGDFQKSDNTWGTLLVGGLGAGGRGFYALDITTQSTFGTATETTLASTLPLWEFTAAQDADLGFTFNEPKANPLTGAYQQIAKVADAANADGVWRVLVGNGYGSANGKAVLFMLNANTGDAVTKLDTATGPQPNGLSAPAPVDNDRDGLIDTVYAGDLLGNMHKFQFSKPDGANFVLAKPAELGGAWRYLGNVFASGEPITTAPTVVQACKGIGSTILFGTGKLNEDVDYSDKTNRGFYRVDDVSPSSALTVSPSELASVSTYTPMSLSANVAGRNWSTPNLNGKKGWKLVFSDGERVLTNSTLPPDSGAVVFGTTKPVGDICTPGNSGFLMSVNVCSGGIGELIYNGTVTGGIGTNTTGILKVSTSYTSSTGKVILVTNQDECKKSGACEQSTTKVPRGRYSWREVLTK